MKIDCVTFSHFFRICSMSLRDKLILLIIIQIVYLVLVQSGKGIGGYALILIEISNK